MRPEAISVATNIYFRLVPTVGVDMGPGQMKHPNAYLFFHFYMRKTVVNHFLFERLITVQNKLHCVFTNEDN